MIRLASTDVEVFVFVFGDCTVLLHRTRLLLGLPLGEDSPVSLALSVCIQ